MSEPAFSVQQLVDDSVLLRVDHIPAVAAMCHRLGLIDIINDSIPCNTGVDIGTLVTGMICDTLSGRSPDYKVEKSIATQDTWDCKRATRPLPSTNGWIQTSR